MITLRKYRNDMVSINIVGDNFYVILDMIRKFETREWIPKQRCWCIPLTAVGQFLSTFYSLQLSEIVIWNTEVVILYRQWKKYITKQLKIKQYNLKKTISVYNQLIATEEKLFPFQTIGAHFLYHGTKACLTDVVGLGKTPQSILAAERCLKQKNFYNVIIVVPAGIKMKWGDDVAKFLGENRSIVIDGNKETRIEQYKAAVKKKHNFMIVNYDLAIWDWEDILFPLLDKYDHKRLLIFDEVQYLKNNDTKRYNLCSDLSLYFDAIYGLSATIVETSLMDLFNVLMIVNDRVLGIHPGRFYEKHAVTDFTGKIVEYKDLDVVVEAINPVKIRRIKEQVFDQLPDRLETTYWCKMDNDQVKCYEDVQANVIDDITSEQRQDQIGGAEILTQINYLQQVCLSSEMVDYKIHSSAKLKLLFELFETIGDTKVIVFCYYKKMLEIIKDEMIKAGYDGVFLAHGGTVKNANHKRKIAKIFNSDSMKIKTLLTSDVFKVGEDLYGASILIHFDLLWNPASMEQRNGRIDRIGQTADKINIYYLLAENTVEQRMWSVLYERGKLFEKLIEEGYKPKRVKKKDMLYIAGVSNGK